MRPAPNIPGRRQPSLVFVLSDSQALVEQVTRELAAVDEAVEVHVLRDDPGLRDHLTRVTPDVVVLDRQAFTTDDVRALLVGGPLAATPTLVIDARFSATRRREALAAGAVDYLHNDEQLGVRLREAFRRARRIPALESRIEESERHYQDILEASSDGIFVLVDGRFHYVNASFAHTLATRPEKLVGQCGLVDFVPEAERAGMREELARIAMSGGVRDVLEVVVATSTDAAVRLEIACRTSTVEGRRAVVGVARDVTAVRELQNEIERSRQRAAQVERLRALGELAAGVAHDFNNSLEAILGRVTMAREHLGRGEHVDKDLEVIESAARDAAATVRRIRDFSRPSGGDSWHDVDIAALTIDAVELTRSALPGKVELTIDAWPTPRIRGNAAELREVLVNLLRNAVDACLPGGGHVRASTSAEDGCAVVAVTDDGHGMSPEVQQRIFEPFFTTKDEAGTGLGLSVSHGILRRHDAVVQVESAEGRGTTFRLIFAPLSQTRPRAAVVSGGPTRVLVVDDDPNIAELLHDVLTEHGYEVRVAGDVGDATRWLLDNPADLMITDLDLPGMSGWQLARKVRELQPQIVVGLITGWPLGAPDGELKARGVDFVLTKPFSMEALLGALEKLR